MWGTLSLSRSYRLAVKGTARTTSTDATLKDGSSLEVPPCEQRRNRFEDARSTRDRLVEKLAAPGG